MSILERAILAVILIEIPIQLDVYLDFQESEAALGALGGWNVSVTTICLALLYAAWLPQVALRRTPLSPSLLRAMGPAMVYIAVTVVSALGAYHFKSSLFELFLLAQAFLLLFYLVRRIRSERDVLFVVVLLLAGVVIESLITEPCES